MKKLSLFAAVFLLFASTHQPNLNAVDLHSIATSKKMLVAAAIADNLFASDVTEFCPENNCTTGSVTLRLALSPTLWWNKFVALEELFISDKNVTERFGAFCKKNPFFTLALCTNAGFRLGKIISNCKKKPASPAAKKAPSKSPSPTGKPSDGQTPQSSSPAHQAAIERHVSSDGSDHSDDDGKHGSASEDGKLGAARVPGCHRGRTLVRANAGRGRLFSSADEHETSEPTGLDQGVASLRISGKRGRSQSGSGSDAEGARHHHTLRSASPRTKTPPVVAANGAEEKEDA